MALIIFLSKVANIEITKSKSDLYDDSQESLITDEIMLLFCAKVSFRGINLWSNNVPIIDGTASFIARGKKPKKFNFNLATVLLPDDKLRIEFYTVTMKKNHKKLIGIFELILESLIDRTNIDLAEENLSDPNNYLIKSTVDLKLYYTAPSIDREKAVLGATADDEEEVVDWMGTFDEGGQHGGHRSRHVRSKNDSKLKKIGRKIIGRGGDADTDSYSDTEFDGDETRGGALGPMTEEDKLKAQYNNLELLEKSLGRYEGDIYHVQEWQIMVHVIQARDIAGLDINPYVCVQIEDQKRYTGVHKTTNSPFFGEFFTFDFTLPATQMMEKVIYFKVHHEKKFVSTFTHTKPIGIFKVDVATVYNERDHAFERKWAQLVNPDAIQVACGNLLLSVAIAQRGVSSKNILGEIAQGDDDELKPSKTFIPSAMPRSLFPVQFKISFFTATELPEMMTDFLATVSKKIIRSDAWEPVDPYVEVTYNAAVATTEHRNGTSPVWGEALYLIGQFPPLVRTIKLALKDHAAVQQDRIIASSLIDLFAISESNPSAGFLPTFGPTWMFLYGSPREYTMSRDKDGLGEGMGEAVCYKGRLLMEIECHPISGDNTSVRNVQKESGVAFPEASKFPMKRTFLLFGCIYDVSMIDKGFGNAAICFELSIGPSGYLNPDELASHKLAPSITRPYPRVPIKENTRQFRLPIDLQKPIVSTKYTFHDYTYRMATSNRLKRAADHMDKLIREFELQMNSKATDEVLTQSYRQMEQYIYTLPCGCGQKSNQGGTGIMAAVHPTLAETLGAAKFNLRMNTLDEKRRKKILHNLESLKGWISTDIDFDESKRFETVKQLHKIARSLKLLASDIQPALPDVFVWMICDSKRVAYSRLSPEDLLYSACEGDKGLFNGRVQTLLFRAPRTTDKPMKSTTNAKVQMYLWLGTEEQEPHIFKHMPPGFEMPPLPLPADYNYIRYTGRSFYEIRCHLSKARSLIAADETGLSDPYLCITTGDETQTTPIIKQTLCPQWDITLVFRNMMHVGTRETASEIIGGVVIECYDYDDAGDGPDLIGRFSTKAKLDLFNDETSNKQTAFQWYEFKFGEKRAGELLAVFELIELNPETPRSQPIPELEQIAVTADNYPPDKYIMKLMKNDIYCIPHFIMHDSNPYEIEVLFWGLRELRSINLQSIQQAEVSIECAGARITKTIKDAQKNPNFEYTHLEPDKYKLLVALPNDNKFWPHLSIYCVQTRLFGMKEVVGNLVVTDLQKYLEKPFVPLTSNGEAVADAVNEFSKTITYDFNRVRRSVIDAYEATIAGKDQDSAKKKLSLFERESGLPGSRTDSVKELMIADALAEETEGENNDETGEGQGTNNLTNKDPTTEAPLENQRFLTTLDKVKRTEMEKTATWWNKYYASKAKLRLERKPKIEYDDLLEDSRNVYAEFFENERKTVVKQHRALWNRAKKIFIRAGKARKELHDLATHRKDRLGEKGKPKSAVDESLDAIENERLQELTLLQTFDIVDTELENVRDYEGFNDCLDKFPLYKGKGISRSDEMGDESRVYAKLKAKFRIRELNPNTSSRGTLANIDKIPRMSVNPALFSTQSQAGATTQQNFSTIRTNEQLLKFDFNRNPITLKCRLYIIKALLFRAWDRSGKADPYIKVFLNNTLVIDDVKSRIYNTLEPMFGKSYEFDVTIPQQSLLRIQIWDWDLTSVNDKIAETNIDIENRWLSCHRATCGLPKRYDSAGYNVWRDTKPPETILNELCQTTNLNLPVYTSDFTALAIGDIRFNCDLECVEFLKNKSANDLVHRKAHHESPERYLRQNTALVALHEWGRKINPHGALVAEHIECRSLFDPTFPDVEQGKLEMWMDMFPMSRPPPSSPVDITPPKPTSYQLRLTVWNTSDVELNDENFITGEKTSDIYVKAWILGENEDAQVTDVHYRSLTGEGNFNWRFVYDFDYIDIEEKIIFERKDSVFQIGNTVKKIPPRIVVRVYDADLLSADDFLGECILNMTHLPIGAKTPNKCKAEMLLDAKYRSTSLFTTKRMAGWWPMIAPLKAGEIRDATLLGGKLEAEFSLVTAADAVTSPVGRGREAPMPLDEPNRPKTSFLWFMSPWKTLRYVIWRNFKWPLIIGVVIIIFVVFLLLCLWSLPGAVVQQIFNKVFKTNGASK